MGGPPGVSPSRDQLQISHASIQISNRHAQSQVAPLPSNLPVRIISKTIGSGAYASIRKAIPHGRSGPVIAVKFINKEHAFREGRLRPKQLHLEASLHNIVSGHDNVLRFFQHGEDNAWVWMMLELAEGGDLFDKIEADEGVSEDVAHFYFTQLVAAVDWCHNKGVAHRDIKPENVLLSGQGDLKLADFGLATQFLEPKSGQRKICGMVCGSPPYIAPEILDVGTVNNKRRQGEEKKGYDPQVADVWSCAIVLFVLLAGNTPWDAPVLAESYEYNDYVKSGGQPSDELWGQIPADALSLIRGMLKVAALERFTMLDVRRHPWFTRHNPEMNDKGKAANPIGLATKMLESLHIDFSKEVSMTQSQQNAAATQRDDVDMTGDRSNRSHLSSTQPEAPITPIAEMSFDWEAPDRRLNGLATSSQPTTYADRLSITARHDLIAAHLTSFDPSMSQFAPSPSLPLTLTQAARKFKDIVPAHSLARFISALPFSQLMPMLYAALHRLNVPVPDFGPAMQRKAAEEGAVSFRIKTVDSRQQPLHGSVVVEKIDVPGQVGLDVLEVRFLKNKGDPLGWRRLFKQVVVLCKDGVIKGQAQQ